MQRSGFMRMLASAPLVATVAITASAAAHAQITTGTVRGVVRDPAGLPLKNVTVFLMPSKGQALTSVTDKDGAYVFLGVQPGSYAIHAELETYQASKDSTITVTQDLVSTIDVQLSKSVTQTGTTTVNVASVRRGQSSDQVNVTSRTEQLTKSQPNDLYQFPGLVFGQPGVTFDSGGYVHLKGGDYNQVGFQLDGIPITEPLYNGFATNVVTVGLKSASVLTGGADASFGGFSSGFINEATENGRDVKGGTLEYTSGPSNGWGYKGANIKYGNVTGNGKFDYYFNTILFNSNFPGNTQISEVKPSEDFLGKFNVYLDSKDTFTAFLSSGRERYNDYEPGYPAGTQFPSFNPVTGLLSYSTNFDQYAEDQRYDLDYFNYKRNFSDTSFANFKVYNLFNRSELHEELTDGRYLGINTMQTGYTADYNNQITHNYLVKAGFQYVKGSAEQHYIQGIPTDDSTVNSDGLVNSVNGLTDRSYKTKPDTTTLYLSNQLRALEDKLTLDFGLRYSQMKYGLSQADFSGATIPASNLAYVATLNGRSSYTIPSSLTDHYVDPRVGVSYSPTSSFVLRSSYSINSEFPDSSKVESLPGFLAGYPVTSSSTTSQVNRFLRNYIPYNALKTEHTNSIDLGGEKGFTINKAAFSGQYAVGADLFRRVAYNLIQLEFPNYAEYGAFNSKTDYTQNGRPYNYSSEGKQHSNGYDITLSKKLVKKTDWNGFATYNGLVAKGTSEYTNGYLPYYASNLQGTPGLDDATFRQLISENEVPTSWDQKSAVSVVANKRIFKWFDTTVFMDAGSGFPFNGGTGTNDSQHTSFQQDGATFYQVPIVVDGNVLQPNNPVAGQTGWHYKFTLNSNFHIAEDKTVFVNIDNIFNKKTTIVEATAPLTGASYYNTPTAQFPQGKVYYGQNTIITPKFVSIGLRIKF